MSEKFNDVVDACVKQMKTKRIAVDEKLLTAITKSLGPSVYQKDALLVAASDKKEMAGIKKNFLIGKLGCKDESKLDKAIDSAIESIGRSNKRKMRPVFYYLLVKELGRESVYR